MNGSNLPCGWPLALGFGPLTVERTDFGIRAGLAAYLLTRPAVAALVGDRITPGYLERGKPLPGIDYKVRIARTNAPAGPLGFAVATVDLNCWSTIYDEACAVADALREALFGFRGWMGCCWVNGAFFEDEDDEPQEPKDGSGDFQYCVSLTYEINFKEAKPQR